MNMNITLALALLQDEIQFAEEGIGDCRTGLA